MNTVKIHPDIESITSADIELFLRRMGWEVIETKYKNYKLAKSPVDEDGNFVEIPYPTNTQTPEYKTNLKQFLYQIAQVLNEEPTAMTLLIKEIGSDFVYMRVSDPFVVRDSISLPLAEKLISSFHDLLKYGAQAVEEIKTHFVGRLGAKSNSFADNCRFAHTFKGSFGITIESPLYLPSVGMEAIKIQKPFERKVVEQIFKGLTITEAATENNSADIIVEHYDEGFNANMCEALVRVAEGINFMEVEYQAAWSPLVSFDPKIGIKNKVHLKERSFKLLSDAARHLKKVEDEKEVTIVGYITSLKAPVGFFKDEDTQRLIDIQGTTTDGDSLKVLTHLSINDYLEAIEAHKSNLDISITGELKKVGKRWRLISYSNFTVRK